MPIIKYIIICVKYWLISIISLLTMAFAADKFTVNHDERYFLGFLIGPIVETILFQSVFFWLSKKYNINIIYTSLVSAFAFLIWHQSDHVWRMFHILYIGFVFQYSYHVAKNNSLNPLLATSIIHSLHNMTITFLSFIYVSK